MTLTLTEIEHMSKLCLTHEGDNQQDSNGDSKENSRKSYRILEKECWTKMTQLDTKLVTVLKGQKSITFWGFLLDRNLYINIQLLKSGL